MPERIPVRRRGGWQIRLGSLLFWTTAAGIVIGLGFPMWLESRGRTTPRRSRPANPDVMQEMPIEQYLEPAETPLD